MDKHNEIPDYFNQNPDDNKEDDFTPTFEPIIEGLQDDYDPDVLDLYLSAQAQLPLGENLVLGKVIARKHDIHGNPIGKSTEIPFLI
jgi:hypothetical protein